MSTHFAPLTDPVPYPGEHHLFQIVEAVTQSIMKAEAAPMMAPTLFESGGSGRA